MSFFWEHESDRCRYPNFEVHTYPWPRYTILDSRFPPVMRSRKAGLPFATRARKRELSIQEVRIENDSDQKFSKTKCFQSFSENHFFSTIHVTLIIMSRKYFFDFRSPDLPFDIRFWTRGFLLVMRSRKAGFPFATRARKRELSIQEVRIENDSDQKFSKTKCFQSFSENHFFPRFMST